MSVSSRTIIKIFQETFIGDSPIVKNILEHKEFLAFLKQDLKQIKNVAISNARRWNNTIIHDCIFSIQGEPSAYLDDFTITFNQEHELIISHYSHQSTVYHIEQIYTFIEQLKLEHDKIKGRRLKTEKINHLKQLAILAKIKEIAKEDEFDFYITKYKTKLKLSMRIENKKLLEVDIPYGKFQDILKDLRSLIKTIRELQKSGITFRFKPTSKSIDDSDWINYTSL